MEYLFQVRDVTKVTSLNEGAAVVISTWLITVTTIIFVLSRLGIKMVTMRKIQVDDYLIVGALVPHSTALVMWSSIDAARFSA